MSSLLHLSESNCEHCPYSQGHRACFFSQVFQRPILAHVSTEGFSCRRATAYEAPGKWPWALASRLLWLIRYSRGGSGALRAFPPKHRFTFWLWMGVILKHANAVSLGLYQLMQVSVGFGWDSKARGEKDALRVRKGCINLSRITLPPFSMARILWRDPLWGGSLPQKRPTLSWSRSLAPRWLFEVGYLSGV